MSILHHTSSSKREPSSAVGERPLKRPRETSVSQLHAQHLVNHGYVIIRLFNERDVVRIRQEFMQAVKRHAMILATYCQYFGLLQ